MPTALLLLGSTQDHHGRKPESSQLCSNGGSWPLKQCNLHLSQRGGGKQMDSSEMGESPFKMKIKQRLQKGSRGIMSKNQSLKSWPPKVLKKQMSSIETSEFLANIIAIPKIRKWYPLISYYCSQEGFSIKVHFSFLISQTQCTYSK